MLTLAEKTRKTIIEIARRRQRPGSGSAAIYNRERTARMMWPDLNRILIDVPFVVVGAVATRLYMPERSTRDLDAVVLTAHREHARQCFLTAGWQSIGVLSIGSEPFRSQAGETVDIIEGRDNWWLEAISGAQSNRDAQGLPILPFPYLVLMKFRAGRTVDLGDISRMLGLADDQSLAQTRALFRRLESSGLEDLESLITLGQLEMNP